MTYRAPVSELQFLLRDVLGYGRVTETERFAEAAGEMTDAILTEAARLAEEVMAPLQRAGDLHPARLENGVVRTSPGFADGYKAIAEGGWVGMTADPEHGGMGLPLTLATGVNEMMHSACLALALNPLLTQGQIEALEAHASDEIKATYLPKLTSGTWTGTMNLTEPQAGSDVGALRSKAVPNGDGTYAVSGQKIYISWGDHDVAENVCHLVLARLPDGRAGTKGISLFIVPKYLPDEAGNPGKANSLRTVSLEHKMGLHGSPTAVMEFDGATGWLVGAEHGGMAAMFTMMNNARLAVGVEGLGIAEAATQKAVAFALDRVQGRVPVEGGTGTILDHADVRRMVLRMKALTATARGICLDTALSFDMAQATGGEEAKTWAARGAFLTPIAKAHGTDIGCEVAELGIQVHGGMGYVEETGAAQFYRDVKVTTIYEGTNGIQAMDMVARKLMDGGDAARAMLAEVQATADRAAGSDGALAPLGAALGRAVEAVAETLDWMLGAEMNDRFAGARPFLTAFGHLLGGHYLLAAALAGDSAERVALARFQIMQILPGVGGLCLSAQQGAEPLYAFPADALTA
ncbi:acyl-CoA dehydrogenase [Oceanomicrobium pacificus]|uniref:3-methylmercaptopropionyl-CoA dehydrogenase n=1 Tax=Oceanomicrobium pacificus TaxID=2692916 RepID=A0A6B0TYN4_9RHOB|nr:acyl-CoA dehydrogenase [Oceanomicrobium pacificus]MXU66805.1 acyl-CoA dehydrogenase [Oceanomicrobium pacificus]